MAKGRVIRMCAVLCAVIGVGVCAVLESPAGAQTGSTPSSTTVTVAPTVVALGAPVTYHATVTGSAHVPTGAVTFSTSTTTLCTGTLSSAGTAQCQASKAPIGPTDSVSAAYSGDPTYATSSGTASLAVAPKPPSPPADATASTSGVSGPGGQVFAAALDFDVKLSGYGSLTVASYGKNPTGTSVKDGTGAFYDVAISAGSVPTSLMASDCDPHEATALEWFDGSAWVGFSDEATSGGCLSATITGSTSPSLAQITGIAVALATGSPPPPPPSPSPPPPSPAPPPTPTTHGYWLVGSDGGIFSFGAAPFYGSTGAMVLQRPVVGIVPTTHGGGYWLDASDGGVFSFGDTQFHGSLPGLGLLPAGSGLPNSLAAPIVGMVASADGHGYFMVGSDGGVFAFGDAHFAGSCPGIGGCAGPAVAVVPDASGNGYWLVTATGAVYAFGDAPYLGSPGPQTSPVTSAAATPDGKGLWILDAAGQVFAYGDAAWFGNVPAGMTGGLNPAAAIFATSDGAGYWLADAQGKVFAYGDAPTDGDMSEIHLNGPIIAGTGW